MVMEMKMERTKMMMTKAKAKGWKVFWQLGESSIDFHHQQSYHSIIAIIIITVITIIIMMMMMMMMMMISPGGGGENWGGRMSL